ncbi:hypothetical protein DNH61_18755 [Paenibacillus sambharensis]|uniref:Uncharacterized protein n=1 Tax=Paenibacillus sambharensis TaxID=1803190 RepID=A0A2W1L8H3_9BACL|nr:hypothetical protein [Paenibacillus sambharensis]PZD94440.1 hypothetical protein DNH61_18755 [Paenibacillus sambharensis]
MGILFDIMTSEPREAGRIAGLPASGEGFAWKPEGRENATEALPAAAGNRLPAGGRMTGSMPGNAACEED